MPFVAVCLLRLVVLKEALASRLHGPNMFRTESRAATRFPDLAGWTAITISRPEEKHKAANGCQWLTIVKGGF